MNENEQPDLSADAANIGDTIEFAAGIKLKEQQFTQRQILFYGTIIWGAVMTACFLSFVCWATQWYDNNPGIKMDWHFLLLGSGLILPVVVMIWHLMKQVYRSEQSTKDDASGLLWIDVIKEASSALKDVFKK